MTDTPNLGLPFIEGSQAQKHVTHNEALRILDAAIQVAVQDITRTTPPTSPAEGERHVVASDATGAWAGRAQAIATWQDGAWAFLAPRAGWCVWSVADDAMLVFDGADWRHVGMPALDSVDHLGINTSADSSNRLSVRSGAALLAAIPAGDGGSGDVRLQLSRESAGNVASVVFSDNFSGRAEFGLVGSDAFKLKVSADGASFVEAVVVDQATGNMALPRGLALTGVIAPPPLTADQNDYAPAGISAASVLKIAADAPRGISGLAAGAEGRIVSLINVGSAPLTLRDDSAASLAANRFSLGGDLTVAARQGALLRYDGTAARWQALTAQAGTISCAAAQSLTPAQQSLGRSNLGIDVHGADIAAAATLDLDAATGDLVDVTGTTTITAITLSEGRARTVRFTGAPTLTHGASLVLPGGANITTAAGAFAVFRGYASGVVRCVEYTPSGGNVGVDPQALTSAQQIQAKQNLGMAAVQTFLTSDVAINNTAVYFDIVNTGSIGAAGQVWVILGGLYFGDPNKGSSVVRIWDGTATYAESEFSIWGTDNLGATTSIFAVVTLSGPTTFRLSAKGRSTTSGIVKAQGVSGTANKSTSILAIRIL